MGSGRAVTSFYPDNLYEPCTQPTCRTIITPTHCRKSAMSSVSRARARAHTFMRSYWGPCTVVISGASHVGNVGISWT